MRIRMDLLIGGNWSSFFRIGSGSQQKTRHVMEVVSLASLLLVATCIAVGVWILIAIAGSGPILALERVAMESLSDREAEPLVAKVMTSGQFDPQWLATTGFKPKGAYRIVKLPGVAGIVAWKKEGRRNRYTVNPDLPMRHRLEREHVVGDILQALGYNPRNKENMPRIYERKNRESKLST